MRKSVGLDLNGWHDFGCRDWRVDDLDERPGEVEVLDGGYGSVVVEHDGMIVGGPQAILSPNGRGAGWGPVGATTKRRELAKQWHSLLTGTPDGGFAGDFRAAVDALSVQADELVVCMPDRPEMSEARQQDLLTALTGRRRARATLIWRSVALLLDLLDGGSLPEVAEGQRILCVIHGHDGLDVQRLVMRRLDDKPGQFAPERAGAGTSHCPELGLACLAEHAKAAVADANPWLADRPAEIPRLPFNLLFEEPAPLPEEVIRRDNGNWTTVIAPPEYRVPEPPHDLGFSGADADLVILMSPLAERHRNELRDCLADRLGGIKLVLSDPAAAARGALRAARRIELGIAHYLDRLDQISLAVLRRTGPVFEDLIQANETVPGNREYISAPITSLVWTAGMERANFYIRKGPHEIRHWVTSPVESPARDEQLEIRLRQMPAQGWAKLLVTAPDWGVLRRTPIHLDWGSLPVDPRDEAEILRALEGPRPVVPERVRYRADIGLWDGSLRYPGVKSILRSFDFRNPESIKRLADALRASFRLDGRTTVYAVGTDGELPESLDEATRRRFIDAIERIGDDLLRNISDGAALTNNNQLLCLTWIFARCPHAVQRELARALDAIRLVGLHGLLAPRGSVRVVVHGLGRVVTDPEILRMFIPKLYSDIGRPNFLAALSSMLSRPEATPRVLREDDVEEIAGRVILVLKGLNEAHSFGTTFKYALMVIAGLLRVRERDPWALLAGRSAVARSLVDVLTGILGSIPRMPNAIPNKAEKIRIVNELIALLSGDGGRPDILTIMDAMAED